MYCKRCGKEINKDMKHCPYCGEQVVLAYQPIVEVNEDLTDKKVKEKGNILRIISIAVLALVFIGMVFLVVEVKIDSGREDAFQTLVKGIYSHDYNTISKVCMDEENAYQLYHFAEWISEATLEEDGFDEDCFDISAGDERKIDKEDIHEILSSEYGIGTDYTKNAEAAYVLEVYVEGWEEYTGYFMCDEIEGYDPPEWFVITLKIQGEWKLLVIENWEGVEY